MYHDISGNLNELKDIANAYRKSSRKSILPGAFQKDDDEPTVIDPEQVASVNQLKKKLLDTDS